MKQSKQPPRTFQDDPLEPLLTIPELASLLRVSRRHVYNLIDKGLPTLKFGRSVRIHPGDYRRWLARQNVA